MPNNAVRPLAEGPLDIVGDVHGELEALSDLLRVLGYDAAGGHPHRRRLVFVGDLGDRGPDSPGVIRFVAGLVEAGLAQCVLGNHELNLMRGSAKDGNGWFYAEDHDRQQGKYLRSRPATAEERQSFRDFFGTLPLALARDDLRVVHAAWHPPSLAAVESAPDPSDVLGVYRHYAQLAERLEYEAQIRSAAEAEHLRWNALLSDQQAQVPLLEGIGRMNVHFQMSNPVRVLTSGMEQLAARSFYASGKWRMQDRVAWWQDYQDPVPVIFGHYWRWASPEGVARHSRGERDLFAGVPPQAWVGPKASAFCVDYSVGARHRERPLAPGGRFLGRLGAVRWPERLLAFDDGEVLPLVSPDPSA